MEVYVWREFSKLRRIDADISQAGYSFAYAKEHRLFDKLRVQMEDLSQGIVWFYEPMLVENREGEIVWRASTVWHREIPDVFDTKFGRFENHHNGEFTSWLEQGSFRVEGNFEAVFEYGDFVYAVSNQRHFGLGRFGLLQIDQALRSKWLYRTRHVDANDWESFFFLGTSREADGVKVFLSGREKCHAVDGASGELHDKSKILQIGADGTFAVVGDYDFAFGDANNVATFGDRLYFGLNNMVKVLDLKTGAEAYYTNQPQDVVEELMKHPHC